MERILHIYCDGSCYHRDGRMGLGYAFFDGELPQPYYHKSINKHDKMGTNNQAEYLAVINALQDLKRHNPPSWDRINIMSDSQCVIEQINGCCKIQSDSLLNLNQEVQRLLKLVNHPNIVFSWVPRTHPRQKMVDRLSKKGNPYFIHKKKYGY